MKARHVTRGRVQPWGITPRRLAAARRALKRERDSLALFADQVAAEQPSPEQRIEQFDLEQLATDQRHRDLAARQWRWGRRMLSRQEQTTRQEILARWNDSWTPAQAAYFADFVRRQLDDRQLLPAEEGTP